MENTIYIVWLLMVAVFCVAGLVCMFRRISRSERNFRKAREEGVIDSESFPVEK